MQLLFVVIAIFCFVAGIRAILGGKLLTGAALIVAGLLIGPGGVSIYH